jgi:hypothetical protein
MRPRPKKFVAPASLVVVVGVFYLGLYVGRARRYAPVATHADGVHRWLAVISPFRAVGFCRRPACRIDCRGVRRGGAELSGRVIRLPIRRHSGR